MAKLHVEHPDLPNTTALVLSREEALCVIQTLSTQLAMAAGVQHPGGIPTLRLFENGTAKRFLVVSMGIEDPQTSYLHLT